MRKVILFIFVSLMSASSNVGAQSGDNNRAKAYYFVAEDAYNNNNFQDSLNSIDKTEEILGGSNAALTVLRTKNLLKLNELKAAQKYANQFFDYKANDVLTKEVYRLMVEIESKLSVLEKKENQNRIVAIQQQESQREKEKQEFEEKADQLEGIKVKQRQARDKLTSFVSELSVKNYANSIAPETIESTVNAVVSLASSIELPPLSREDCFRFFTYRTICKSSSGSPISWGDSFQEKFAYLKQKELIDNRTLNTIAIIFSELEEKKSSLLSMQLDKITVRNLKTTPQTIKYTKKHYKRNVFWENISIKDMELTFKGTYSFRIDGKHSKYLDQTQVDIHNLPICEYVNQSNVQINLEDTGNIGRLDKYQLGFDFQRSLFGNNYLKQRKRKKSFGSWRDEDWKPGTKLYVPVPTDVGDELISIFQLKTINFDGNVTTYDLNDAFKETCASNRQ